MITSKFNYIMPKCCIECNDIKKTRMFGDMVCTDSTNVCEKKEMYLFQLKVKENDDIIDTMFPVLRNVLLIVVCVLSSVSIAGNVEKKTVKVFEQGNNKQYQNIVVNGNMVSIGKGVSSNYSIAESKSRMYARVAMARKGKENIERIETIQRNVKVITFKVIEKKGKYIAYSIAIQK